MQIKALKQVEIENIKMDWKEIRLGRDPPKFTLGSIGLGSNGLKFELGHDPPNLTNLFSISLTNYYLPFIITIWMPIQENKNKKLQIDR